MYIALMVVPATQVCAGAQPDLKMHNARILPSTGLKEVMQG